MYYIFIRRRRSSSSVFVKRACFFFKYPSSNSLDLTAKRKMRLADTKTRRFFFNSNNYSKCACARVRYEYIIPNFAAKTAARTFSRYLFHWLNFD